MTLPSRPASPRPSRSARCASRRLEWACARRSCRAGNLGSADLELRPQPPAAIGITIDAGIVAGGGFVFLDPDGHTFAGVLELRIGAVSIKALAILDTRTESAPGWSLLLLLYAQFAEPIPIGFGFSLSGVGGIVGLNFGVGVDPLRAALGTGGFDDVLFPADPVADAPRIIGRLRSFFPPAPGVLVLGPAVEITWGGAAPLVVARLAVLAQLSNVTGASPVRFDRLVALGTVRAEAPAGAVDVPPTVRLVADLLGTYDAQTGLLAIDAQLRDSVIAGVAVGGTVIVRVGLGTVPAFALSAGGFHPDFADLPPQLPARIDRISLTWEAGGDVSISLQLQAYVALTAATIQLGASFKLTAKVGSVALKGELGFDLLINRDLSFSAHVVGRVGISYRGRNLAGIGLDMVLSRSSEQVWRVRGTASFEILWWEIDVDFDESWGQSAQLPATRTRVADEIRTALADPANWVAELPAGGEQLVALASPAGADATLAHPLGRLRISQQVAPLDLEIDHVDGARVEGPASVHVVGVQVGPVASSPDPARDPFTRARYQDLDETERLRAKSFESLPSGVVVGDTGFVVAAGIGVGAGHDSRLIGPDPPPSQPPPPLPLPAEWLVWQLASSAAAASPLRTRAASRPAQFMSFEPRPVPMAVVHPGTLLAEPLEPRGRPLACPRRPGCRLRRATRPRGLRDGVMTAAYRFLPWVRRGLAAGITTPDAGTLPSRALLDVAVNVTGAAPVSRDRVRARSRRRDRDRPADRAADRPPPGLVGRRTQLPRSRRVRPAGLSVAVHARDRVADRTFAAMGRARGDPRPRWRHARSRCRRTAARPEHRYAGRRPRGPSRSG